jgi:hypothetical protein
LPPFDRNYGSSLRSASAAPDAVLEIENLDLGADPEPQQKFRRQQRDVMAGGTIDLDEIAMPEVLDPRQIKGLHSGLCSWNVLGALAGFVIDRVPRQFSELPEAITSKSSLMRENLNTFRERIVL